MPLDNIEIIYPIKASSIYHDLYGRWVFEFKAGNAVKDTYRIRLYYNNKFTDDFFLWPVCHNCKIAGNTTIDTASAITYIKNWPL